MRKLALALLAALAPASVLAASLAVPVDHAVRVRLAAPASDIIVGNPAVADVVLADSRHLVITGKTLGVTNLIITGVNGRLLLDRELVVAKPQLGHVTVINGPNPLVYACAPECRKIGDQELSDLGLRDGVQMGAAAAERDALAPPQGQTGGVSASPTTP
jgi:hypothetical protein